MVKPPPWIHALVIAALLVVPIFAIVSYTSEILAVDSALDAGASYDYIAGRADFAGRHPYIPYAQRHAVLLISATCLFVAAIVYSLSAFLIRKSTSTI